MQLCLSWAQNCKIRYQTRPFLKVRVNFVGTGISSIKRLHTNIISPVKRLHTNNNVCIIFVSISAANVIQEKLNRQGKPVSDFGKKADTLLRQRHYEDMLNFTMLRLRGSFADLILGTKKELQKSIDDSFAMQKAELEKSFAKRSAEMEARYTRQAFEAAQSFTVQLQEKTDELTQAQQMVNMVQAQFSLNRDSEIETLQNELTQAQQVANMVQAQFSIHRDSTGAEIARLENNLKQAEHLRVQEASIAQAQLMQERENHQQAIANFDSGRENMVAKLSSTLETLQVQCSNIHNLEGKLRDAEAKLNETQLKLQDTGDKLTHAQHECRQQNEEMEHRFILANETAYLLQNKLDNEIENKNSLINAQKELEKRIEYERERGGLLQQKFDHEVKNTDALINVQKELEKHLEFERSRGDLLQQELEFEIESKKEVVKSLHEASKQRHDEHSGVMKELNRVSEQLRRANEESKQRHDKHRGVVKELNHVSEQLRRAKEEHLTQETNLNILRAKCEEHEMDNSHLKSELCIVTQGREHLESELERVSDQLRQANEEYLTQETNLNMLRAKCEEQNIDNSHLKSELCTVAQGREHLESELERVSDQLRRAHEKESTQSANLNRLQANFEEQVRVVHESNAKCAHLERELQLSVDRVNETTELSSLLEARVAELEAKVQDQILDLEAARLSEIEVEKLLSDCLNEKQILEAKLTTVLAEIDDAKTQLSIADTDYCQDRERFATALQGFEEEMTNAEARLKSILELNAKLEAENEAEKTKFDDSQKEVTNLKVIVQDLAESLSKQALENAEHYETLKKNMEDEMKNQEDQFVKLKNDCKTKVSKYESDIAVYEEAVKMLQKQVKILEELADSEREILAETDETKYENIKEEISQVFLARFNAMKEEHESALTTKDADIAALREKCRKREEYIKQMEKICVKVREDLLKRREHKKKLWGSIERSIQHIKEAKQSKESTICSASTDIIEVVANDVISFDSDVYNDFRSSVLDLVPEIDSFVGSDLQMLLKSFDDEGQCL